MDEDSVKKSPFAGKLASPYDLVDIPKLVSAYYTLVPDPSVLEQKVSFGTSGHRGSSFDHSFNEWHILAITQAIVEFRKTQKIDGPLFLGIDTHALSFPALSTAVEVLAANGVEIFLSEGDKYTPTPAISYAILTYNQKRRTGLADGIVITPSHNPPREGGFKYNPPNGGPADQAITSWIEKRSNELLSQNLQGVKRTPFSKALLASTTRRFNFLDTYVNDLEKVIDMAAIRGSKLNLGVDPLGGAGVDYWKAIKERYNLNLTIVSEIVDPTFSFMTLDWDGQIRMDPSSPDAMGRLILLKDKFDVAFACDTDHDRHGIVTKSSGLLPPNHYLAAAIYYLFQNRKDWKKEVMIGKTVVSSQMIDRVGAKLGRKIFEVPVGFKWFASGLFDGSLTFAGEESAGAAFAKRDGTVWTTDKDGMTAALLSAEITAKMGMDPGRVYQKITEELGQSFFERFDAPATLEQKDRLKKLCPEEIKSQDLAGEKIISIQTKAKGDGASIGGLKVATAKGWFAARPSGTEEIYKIYVESFKGEEHMRQIYKEAEKLVSDAIGLNPAQIK